MILTGSRGRLLREEDLLVYPFRVSHNLQRHVPANGVCFGRYRTDGWSAARTTRLSCHEYRLDTGPIRSNTSDASAQHISSFHFIPILFFLFFSPPHPRPSRPFCPPSCWPSAPPWLDRGATVRSTPLRWRRPVDSPTGASLSAALARPAKVDRSRSGQQISFRKPHSVTRSRKSIVV